MIDEFAAVKALIVAGRVPADPPVFDQSDATLQGSAKPTTYIAISDQTPVQRNARLSAPYASQAFTFAVQHVGKTSNEVRDSVRRTRAALERQRLLAKTTPLRLIDEGWILRDPDTAAPRLYTATDVWRCAANTH